MSIKKVTILGERCSGTNYLEKLIKTNFNVEFTWEYGWKHYFGFNDYSNSDDTLFICITKHYYDYIDSFFRNPPPSGKPAPENLKNIDNFLSLKFVSRDQKNKVLVEDRNIYTKEEYKNILEMRHVKLKYMIDDFPKIVKNYLLIRYEDLMNDFENTMNKIKDCGLKVKQKIDFPENYFLYKDTLKKFGQYKEVKNKNYKKFGIEKIHNNENFNKFYEERLGYYLKK